MFSLGALMTSFLPATPKPARASDQPPLLALASFVRQRFGDERPFCILLTTYHPCHAVLLYFYYYDTFSLNTHNTKHSYERVRTNGSLQTPQTCLRDQVCPMAWRRPPRRFLNSLVSLVQFQLLASFSY